MDLSKVTAGRNPPKEIHAFIEIPFGGVPVYELEQRSETFCVDRNGRIHYGKTLSLPPDSRENSARLHGSDDPRTEEIAIQLFRGPYTSGFAYVNLPGCADGIDHDLAVLAYPTCCHGSDPSSDVFDDGCSACGCAGGKYWNIGKDH
jgi:hypothetical protein